MLVQLFGDRLSYLRRVHNMTQAELACAVGVTTQHLGLVERGKSGPSLKLIEQLAQALDTEPANLFLFNDAAVTSVLSDNSTHLQTSPRNTGLVGLWRYNVHDAQFHFSTTFFNILGYPARAFAPSLQSFLEHVFPEDRSAIETEWQRLQAGDFNARTVFRFLRKDGTARLGLIQGEVETKADNALSGYQGVFFDLTEQKNFESLLAEAKRDAEQLRDEQTAALRTINTIADREVKNRVAAEKQAKEKDVLFKTLFENMHDGFIRSNADGRVIFANKAAAVIFGYDSPARIIGLHASELFAAPEEHPCLINLLMQKEFLHNHELQFRRKDGGTGWGLSNYRVIRNANGDLMSTEAVIRDITSRKAMEDALRNAMELLRDTASIAKTGGWTYTPDTGEVVWTEETYRIHEVPTDYAPTLAAALSFYHTKDRQVLRLAVEKALQSGEPYDLELRFATAQGKQLWVRTKCAPILKEGNVALLRGIVQDITEHKEADAKLRLREKQLQVVLMHAPIGIAIVSQKGLLIDCNLNFARMIGYTRDELTGMDFKEVTHPDDLAGEFELIRDVLSGKNSEYSICKRFIHKNGYHVTTRTTSTLVRDDHDENNFAFAFIEHLKGY